VVFYRPFFLFKINHCKNIFFIYYHFYQLQMLNIKREKRNTKMTRKIITPQEIEHILKDTMKVAIEDKPPASEAIN